ncbi:MAG: hypothetical protein K8E66_11440, partial [Phycisphaerales bacterium]|nr:hypothetical protein [Phycisphaerales bacterium]
MPTAARLTRPSQIRPLACLAAISLAAAPAFAEWPSDPNSPLLIGGAQGFFGPRQSIVAADDGAVWVAWQDSFCVGDLRLQRVGPFGDLLTPLGLAVQADPTCGFTLPPALIATQHGATLSRAFAGLNAEPVQSFNPSGQPLWTPAFTTDEVRTAGQLLGMTNGDVMIASMGFN